MRNITVGVIGVGRFGRNYVNTLKGIEGANLKWICANSKETLAGFSGNHNILKTISYEDALSDPALDAVAIVTPASTHYAIAKEALEAGKHIIVEKPVTLSSKECRNLVKISGKSGRVFMAAHIHRYNPAIRKMKEDIDAGAFGDIRFAQYTHAGNGPVRREVSALWDFFPHLMTIMRYFFNEMPTMVSATGASFLRKGVDDAVSLNMAYRDGKFVTAFGTWLYAFKRMDLALSGEKGFAIFDDCAPKEKLRYYSYASHKKISQSITNKKEYVAPSVPDEKPLTNQLIHFIDCIRNGKKPITGGEEALDVARFLEHAQKSLENNGKAVTIR